MAEAQSALSSERGRPTSRRHKSSGSSSSSSVQPSPGSWGVTRGRSRVRRQSEVADPFSEAALRKRGYHSFRSFDKIFHVEKRWKLVREMGSGAYGVVISAADDISGETIAIKLVSRIFEKTSLAKRALREIALLRHFNNHENITGLIDVDAIAPNFNEMYLFMEPMEADLHQIIRSGQSLTNEHVQYFTYQILRGMKYVHSASVVHRDLKPGNLLVNSDCELKICDFGLSRGFESGPDELATKMTEYVATRWYRAPEIMLAFKRYNTAIDVWSIGCILAELLLGKPIFKGKDYVDQLNKILDVLGTPTENVITQIGSERARAYVRSLPIRKRVPFSKFIPLADPQALDLLEKMLCFDPESRITVGQALEHPWLAGYHDVDDEPLCPTPFDRWREIEALETIEQFREALWKEIEEYRKEVRSFALEMTEEPTPLRSPSVLSEEIAVGRAQEDQTELDTVVESGQIAEEEAVDTPDKAQERKASEGSLAPIVARRRDGDPLVSYARRASIFSIHSAHSTRDRDSYFSRSPEQVFGRAPSFVDDGGGGTGQGGGGGGGIAFPSAQRDGYVIPARSRTASTVGGAEVPRKLLRTLSTVSIYESVDAGGSGEVGGAPIARYIREAETEADAPPSEMPGEFRGEKRESWSKDKESDKEQSS